MPSPFPCSPVIRECSWKKTQIEKKTQHDNVITRKVWLTIISKIFSRLTGKCCSETDISFVMEKIFFHPTTRRKIFCNNVVSVNYRSLILSKYRVGEKDHCYDVKFLFLAWASLIFPSFLFSFHLSKKIYFSSSICAGYF